MIFHYYAVSGKKKPWDMKIFYEIAIYDKSQT